MMPCDDAQSRLDFCHRDYLRYRELIGDLMPPTALSAQEASARCHSPACEERGDGRDV